MAPAGPNPEKLPTRVKLINGIGAVAFGVKDNGFSVFLLLYYNQVLGMDAGLVSLALMLALLIDALVDPLIGHLCDRTYTRWGKRLPWLYAAPIPLAIAWIVLWMPPMAGAAPSFWGLLGIAVTVRILLSCCEVPSISLVAELSRDYDERTSILRYRFLFGWMGGLLLLFLAYDVFMADGLLQREGYAEYGLFGAAVIVVSVLASARGLHHRIAGLPDRKPPPFSFRSAFSEIREALSHRAFLILMAGGAAAFVSQGLTFALNNYLYLFVWQFSPEAFRAYPLVLFASVVASFFLVSPLHHWLGKRETAISATLVALVLWSAPYVVRHFGMWPEEGSAASSYALFAALFAGNSLAVVVMISISSMIADVVDASEEATGRREEGTFFAGNFFMQKCSTGLGIFIAGQLVSLAGLSDGATPGKVAEPVLDTLGISYAVVIAVLALVSASFIRRFPITRADHLARIALLDATARAEAEAPGTII